MHCLLTYLLVTTLSALTVSGQCLEGGDVAYPVRDY